MTYDPQQLKKDLLFILNTIGCRKQVGFFNLPSYADENFEIVMYSKEKSRPSDYPHVYGRNGREMDLNGITTDSVVGNWILETVVYAEELIGHQDQSLYTMLRI